MAACLFVLITVLAQSTVPPPAATAADHPQPGISDNSFLIEEAYNQDRGVVQHISTFSRDVHTGSWVYTFTQEWPVDAAPRHQLSYTLAALSPDERAGFGDLLLNYRYQVLSGAHVAFAPRVTAIVPSGDPAFGRGAGGAGVQAAAPVSVQAGRWFALHSNAGFTIVPHAKDAAGDTARTAGYYLGQSVVWLARSRVNGLVELLWNRQQSVAAPSLAAWGTSTVINPGVRWAYNFPSGLQIVPGVSVPLTLTPGAPHAWSILGYLSFEHPFTSVR